MTGGEEAGGGKSGGKSPGGRRREGGGPPDTPRAHKPASCIQPTLGKVGRLLPLAVPISSRSLDVTSSSSGSSGCRSVVMEISSVSALQDMVYLCRSSDINKLAECTTGNCFLCGWPLRLSLSFILADTVTTRNMLFVGVEGSRELVRLSSSSIYKENKTCRELMTTVTLNALRAFPLQSYPNSSRRDATRESRDRKRRRQPIPSARL